MIGKGQRLRTELARKTIHVGTGCVPLLYALWDHRPAILALLGVCFLGMLLIEWARRAPGLPGRLFHRSFTFMLRDKESDGLLGATAYCGASLICVALFSREVAVLSLLNLALGDTAASLVGMTWGRTRIGHKSLEGGLAFWAVASLIALTAWWCAPSYPLRAALIAAPLVALTELLVDRIDDNWVVPLTSGVFIFTLITLGL